MPPPSQRLHAPLHAPEPLAPPTAAALELLPGLLGSGSARRGPQSEASLLVHDKDRSDPASVMAVDDDDPTGKAFMDLEQFLDMTDGENGPEVGFSAAVWAAQSAKRAPNGTAQH